MRGSLLVKRRVDLLSHLPRLSETWIIRVEECRAGRAFSSLSDKFIRVGGSTFTLPLTLNLLEDPHAGDIEQGTHSPISARLVRHAKLIGGIADERMILERTKNGPGTA